MLEEGVVGLDTEMGKRIVGLVLRPTEGLIELASGGLDNVQKSYHIYKTENFKNVTFHWIWLLKNVRKLRN